jgi:3-phenylpropionate/trans-cinnamate dioxygenase ferredoxin reductase subunit
MSHAVTTRRDRLRFGAFVGVVGASFLFAFLRPGAGDRDFAVNLADALGFAALALIVLQLVVPAPPRIISAAFRPTLLIRFHGRFGHLALLAAVGHVVVLVVDDADRLNLLDFPDVPGRARAALVALVALAALTVAALRRRHGRQTLAWRTFHVTMGVVALAFAVGHVMGVGGYLGLDAFTGTTITLVVSALVLAVYLRPHRPHQPRVDSSR